MPSGQIVLFRLVASYTNDDILVYGQESKIFFAFWQQIHSHFLVIFVVLSRVCPFLPHCGLWMELDTLFWVTNVIQDKGKLHQKDQENKS